MISMVSVLQEGQMPNCTAYPNEFDFRHNINDDQFLVFALGKILH